MNWSVSADISNKVQTREFFERYEIFEPGKVIVESLQSITNRIKLLFVFWLGKPQGLMRSQVRFYLPR